MTEEEWLNCTDLPEMLEFLADQTSDRKLLLFAVACCQRIWPFLHPHHSQRVVDLVERVAENPTLLGDDLQVASFQARNYAESDEGRLTEISCSAAYAAASMTEDYPGERKAWIASLAADCVRNTYYWMAYEAEMARGSTDERARIAGNGGESGEEVVQITLLREIIGNPFRPMSVDPSWLTSDVVALARGIYEDRAFDRMPILADALQDAGCDNNDILNHCRDEKATHVRGCWVVDLVRSVD